MMPYCDIDLGPISKFIHVNANSMEISFCSRRIFMKVFTMKFRTWHDSCTVVACVKFCRDMVPSDGVTVRSIFHWIWITMENPSWNVRAMACFLTTQSNYPNDCWLLSNEYFGIHWGHGWAQRTLFNKILRGNTDLEILFLRVKMHRSTKNS